LIECMNQITYLQIATIQTTVIHTKSAGRDCLVASAETPPLA
jgi:hypothetical protein